MAFPNAGSASGFVEDWRRQRPASSHYYFGWGWGADLGGLATQGAPVPPGSPARVTYPFKSLDGAVTVDRQRTGQRVFDYSNEGVAHYGLYADWTDEVRKLGGPQIVDDLLRGPEAYLQMWERSVGVPATRCLKRRARLRRGLGPIRPRHDSAHPAPARRPAAAANAGVDLLRQEAAATGAAAAVLTPEWDGRAGRQRCATGIAPDGIRPGTRLAEPPRPREAASAAASG